jgi:TolA-binding protein
MLLSIGMISICMGNSVAAQQSSQSSSSFPVQLVSVEERIKELEEKIKTLEEKQKDNEWDKFSGLANAFAILLVALMGGWFTRSYNERELAATHVNIIHDFIDQLKSEKAQEVQTALTAIGYLALPYSMPDLLRSLASNLGVETAAIPVLKALATSSNNKVAKQAEQSLVKLQKEIGQLELSTIRRKVLDLAKRYADARQSLPAGEQRTREMEAVISEMKGLAPAGQPLLNELTNSRAPGDRLAAIAILQEFPSRNHLNWLAEMIAEDPGAFHGYHAAVALDRAVHDFGEPDVKPSITKLRDLIRAKPDGYELLKEAAFSFFKPPQQQVVKWAKNENHKAINPDDMGPKNYEACSYDLGYPGWDHPLLYEDNDKAKPIKYQ